MQRKQIISGWGRTVSVNTSVFRPEFIADLLPSVEHTTSPLLAHGCGRSYGDEALNGSGSTLLITRLNRLISFNTEKIELVCEAGVTLHDIQYTFLPQGYALVTSPGTAYVTVAGAIANDVHGKNHDHVGSFGRHVQWFHLLLASGEIIHCSRSQNAAIFFATIGGLGLTGIITTVCLQLQKHPIGVYVQNELTDSVETLMTRLRAARETSIYSVAWLDLSKKNFGRGILSLGEPDATPIEMSEHTAFRVPACASVFLNRVTMRCFNHFYYWRTKTQERSFLQTLPQFLYSLDAIERWNYLYGKRGFYQFQCVIPEENADAGIKDVLKTVRASQHFCYLAVLKTLGGNSDGLLSFPMRGFTLALDFPNHKNVSALLSALSDITVQYKGRVYLAKDASLNAEQFAQMYPHLPEFRAVLNHIDPHKKWNSVMAQRLGIRE